MTKQAELAKISGMSTKTRLLLRKHKIQFLEDLQEVTEEEFLSWTFKNRDVIDEVLQIMKQYSISFREERI